MRRLQHGKTDAIQCVATAAGPEGMVPEVKPSIRSEDKHIPLELKVYTEGKTGAFFNASTAKLEGSS